jgi:glycosyltransferase involved in cell wall biosynthesis
MLSIAMATYNGEKYIYEQIDSILGQTYQDFELVICDDCSTDSTWIILQEYEKKDVRIHCYKNEKNIGFTKNFEKAISYCNGEYIALSDQDDIWTDNHLEILLNNIGQNLLIGSNALLVNEQNESLNITMKDIVHIKDVPNDPYLIFQRLLYMSFIQGASMLFDKILLVEAIPFPEDIPHDYWLSVIAASKSKLIYDDFISLRYRQHSNNVTENRKRPDLKNILSKNRNDQLNVLHTIYTRLTLKNDFIIFLKEAILLYDKDNNPMNKIRKMIIMFFIYKKINFNKSIVLLLYRIFRFSLF